MKKTRLNHVKHDPAVGPFDKGTNIRQKETSLNHTFSMKLKLVIFFQGLFLDFAT